MSVSGIDFSRIINPGKDSNHTSGIMLGNNSEDEKSKFALALGDFTRTGNVSGMPANVFSNPEAV